MNGDVILQDNLSARWVQFSNPVEVVTTKSLAEVREKLQQVDTAVNRRGLHAAGFLAYEAAPAFDPAFQVNAPGDLPLLWFGLYRQAEPVEMPDTGPAYTIGNWAPTVNRPAYEQAIGQIKNYIAQGETYQVNYTMRLRTNFSGNPWGLFVKLARSQQGGFSAFLDTGQHVICSASPEMFFQRTGLDVEAQPMKGTATRGRTLAEDNANIQWLHNSTKNRAENVMIVDMIRNDLSQVADWGTVRVPHLFTVKRYPTILQMITTVTAQTAVSSADLMAALFPCSSITGAPKVRTMEIIAELETGPRGVYTGCIGFMSPGRQAQFNVAIRTVCIDNNTGVAEYGVGSGIVWDSDTTEEYEECRTKAKVLTANRPRFDLLETILWEPERGYFLLDSHLQRLADSVEYFKVALDMPKIKAELAALASTLPDVAHRVRLLVAEDGGITCQAIQLQQPATARPWRVALAASPIDSGNPFLYHKTTHRQVYEQARAGHPDADDVLLWNERGEITESSIANVVFQFGDKLVTPPVESGLLAGTFRGHLLRENIVSERVVTVEQAAQCDRMFLINSVRRWVEVTPHSPIIAKNARGANPFASS